MDMWASLWKCVTVIWERRNERHRQEEIRLATESARLLIAEQEMIAERRRREEVELQLAAKRRQQEEEEQQLMLIAKLKRLIGDEVDLYIRTHRKFDSSQPLRCAVGIDRAAWDEDVSRLGVEKLKTLEDLLSDDDRFIFRGNMVSVRYLTPYQDGLRYYGEYKCRCRNKWNSAASWAGKWQGCKACETQTYPYSQRPRDVPAEGAQRDGKQPHDMERCEQCIRLGKLCMPRRYFQA